MFCVCSYVGPDAIWIMICEAIVVLFILYFLVTECKKLRKVSDGFPATGDVRFTTQSSDVF